MIVCRNEKGETAIFPVGENIHRKNVCTRQIVPARVPEAAMVKAVKLSQKLAQEFQLVRHFSS